MDLATRKRTTIDSSRYLDNDEFTWEVSDYAWSPDSRWVAYSLPRENRNNAIFLYDTVEGRKVQLTDDFYENLNPRFDADGGYLYFLSYRNSQIGMDPFEDNHIAANPARVMVAQLRQGEKPPFVKRPATEAAPAAGDEKATEKKDDPSRFRVDVPGLASRVYALPVDPGNDFHLLAGKGYVAWSSVPLFTEDEYEEIYRPGGETKWTLHLFSMKDQKEVTLEDKIAEAQASVNGDELVLRKEKGVYATSFAKAYESKKLGTEVDLSGMTYRVAPREEWRQIFADAWRWYRDFFYDKDMHGRDWKASRAKYAPWVEEIRTRQQLNWVLSEMVGELSVSHTYISGGDMGPAHPRPTAPAVSAGLLGADLVADPAAGLYRFARVYGPTPYFTEIETPLGRPDVDVKEGDYLLAINGQAVRPPENYFRLLQVGKSDEVSLTVGRGPKDPAPAHLPRQAREVRPRGALRPLGHRQRREGGEAVERRGRLHARHGHGRPRGHAVRQVLAGLPLQEGPRHRRARQRRRLDRVLHDRQARAAAGRVQRAQGHGALPLPQPRLARALRARVERGQRLGRRGLRRALQGAQARAR